MSPSARRLLLFLHAVCPLLFFTDLTRNPYVTQVLLLQGGLLLALILVLGRGLRGGSLTVNGTLLAAPLLSIAGIALLSWALSWRDHAALRPSILHEGFRNNFFLLANGLLPFFLAARETDPLWRLRFRRTALLVGAVAAGYGVLQYAGVEWIWPQALNPYNGRPVSTFGNPNFLSSYLVMILPFGLLAFLEARGAGGRLGWGAALVLYAAATIATMTRSSWIGALAAAALAAWGLRSLLAARKRPLLILGAILLAMALGWPGSPVAKNHENPSARMAELWEGVRGKTVYASWHQRLLIWSCARDMVLERPLLGKGWGCFELFFPFYQGGYMADAVFRNFRTHANNAHNVVMEVASQTGLGGLGASLWLLWSGALLFRRRVRALPEEDRRIAWASAAALAGMLADNVFGNVSLFFAVPGFFFAWTAGDLAGVLSGAAGTRTVSLRRPLPAVVAGALLAASAAGVLWCFRNWRAEVAYFDGYKRVHKGDLAEGIERLELSRRWRPHEVNNDYELANAYLRQARLGLENGLVNEPKAYLEKAVEAYGAAIDANAGYDEIYFNRAAPLARLGRVPEAVRDLRTCLLINPVNAEGYRTLGGLYTREDRMGEAADLFERAVRYFPRDKDMWNSLGYARSREGKQKEAVQSFARALALDVDFKDAESNLRAALAAAGEKEHPMLAAPALAAEVRRRAEAGQFAPALAAAEALSGLAPDCPLSALMRADLLAQTGRHAEAAAAYDRLLALEPDSRPGRLNKARALLALGRRDEARALLDRLLKENPADPDAGPLRRSF